MMIPAVILLLAAGCSKEKEGMTLDCDTFVEAFAIDEMEGMADPVSNEITVTVPEDYDVTAMTVTTLVLSEGAQADIAVGDVMDFSLGRMFRVSNGDVFSDYTIVVEQERPCPEAVFVGTAADVDGLKPEEKAAAQWMLSTIPGSAYVSFADIIGEKADLSGCKIVWWHFHIDGDITTDGQFAGAAPEAIAASTAMARLYGQGTSFLLSRYATYYTSCIGAGKDGRTPNNGWGGTETEGEITGSPWYFIMEGHQSHPIYQGLVSDGTATDRVYTCDTGYRVTNTTAQWHIGEDWGGYPTLKDWESRHGATGLGFGNDGAVVLWEYAPSGSNGGIICIGSGCYDWYAHDTDISADKYHGNVARITENAINYLIGE